MSGIWTGVHRGFQKRRQGVEHFFKAAKVEKDENRPSHVMAVLFKRYPRYMGLIFFLILMQLDTTFNWRYAGDPWILRGHQAYISFWEDAGLVWNHIQLVQTGVPG